MGLNFFGSSCSADRDDDNSVSGIILGALSNPDPTNFTISWGVECGNHTLVEIVYPDCINYEGKKLLIFNATLAEIKDCKVIDPHFCDGDHLSPIARFSPDEQGQKNARKFLWVLNQHPV